jgi:CHAT domain-containing protein/tetratricopeptide (TPR) repeat protein
LASVYRAHNQYDNAEFLLRRGLQVSESAYGREHSAVANAYYLLGDNLVLQNRFGEAEQYLEHAIAIWQKAPHSDDAFGAAFAAVGWVYVMLGKTQQAEAAYLKAIQFRERAGGANTALVAQDLINLGSLYHQLRNYQQAAPVLLRALEIKTKLGAANDSSSFHLLRLLSANLEELSQFERAADFLERAVNIDPARDSEDAITQAFVAEQFRKVAELYAKAGNVAKSYQISGRAVQTYVKYLEKRPDLRKQLRGRPSSPFDNDAIFVTHVRSAWSFGVTQGQPTRTFAESFETAQRRNESFVSDALTLAAARSVASTPRMRALIRKWQDVREEKRRSLSETEQTKDAVARFFVLSGEMDRLVAEITSEAPDFFKLIYPSPLSLQDVQALLGPSDALAMFLQDDECTFVWLLTKESIGWSRINIGEKELTDKVKIFRRGLDLSKLERQNDKKDVKRSGLFDLAFANELYGALFSPIEGLIKDKKQLFIMPSGALTALPFHLLVTEKPAVAVPVEFDGYRDAAWLIKRQAVTILPSISSLKTLRAFPRKDQATKPMIGFGDPVFGPETPPPMHCREQVSAAVTRAYTDFWPGVAVDRAMLAQNLCRLAESADELRTVAQKLGAPLSDIKLRTNATETNVKRIPLSDYRIVYFATHGLVAGDVKGLAEPSLVLSIPKQPSEFDDGLLTASEVAQLKLNADWVVLSACNTIAGDKPGAEALSGLARSFFYAGARALLVSHWAVDSEAATRLTIATFDRLKSDPGIGRAEALRQAMLGYLGDASSPRNAYPAFWGPFALIGEGAAK